MTTLRQPNENRYESQASPCFYHATYGRYLPSIMQHGLGAKVPMKNWNDSVAGIVYLSTSSSVASSYAENVSF
jgi:hypothetical protein